MTEASHDLDHVLRDFGVRSGSRDARATFAKKLAEEGLSAEDARFMGETIDAGANSIEATARRLAAILGDKDRWVPTLSDLRHAEKKRQERIEAREAAQEPEDAPEPPHYPNMPRDPEGDQAAVEGLSVADLRRQKWCRYVWTHLHEGVSAEDLADRHRMTKEQIIDDAQEWADWHIPTDAETGS